MASLAQNGITLAACRRPVLLRAVDAVWPSPRDGSGAVGGLQYAVGQHEMRLRTTETGTANVVLRLAADVAGTGGRTAIIRSRGRIFAPRSTECAKGCGSKKLAWPEATPSRRWRREQPRWPLAGQALAGCSGGRSKAWSASETSRFSTRRCSRALGWSVPARQCGQLYYNSLFVKNLFEFLALEPKLASPAGKKTRTRSYSSRRSRFDNVMFSYPGTWNPVLRGLSSLSQPAAWSLRGAERLGKEHAGEAVVPVL